MNNMVEKVIYSPNFDRMILLKIQEDGESTVEYKQGDKEVKFTLDRLAILMLINESVVLGELQ